MFERLKKSIRKFKTKKKYVYHSQSEMYNPDGTTTRFVSESDFPISPGMQILQMDHLREAHEKMITRDSKGLSREQRKKVREIYRRTGNIDKAYKELKKYK